MAGSRFSCSQRLRPRGQYLSATRKCIPRRRVASLGEGLTVSSHTVFFGANMSEQRIFEVIYIKSPLAAVWNALTNPEMTQQYWGGTRIESDWKVGSKVLYVRNGEVTDEQ